MDIGVVGEQAFLGSMVKVGAMIDRCNLARRTTKDLWLPCIEMRIEVNHGDGTIGTVDRSQKRKSDRVVSSKSYDSGKCLSVLCWTQFLCVGSWCAAQD